MPTETRRAPRTEYALAAGLRLELREGRPTVCSDTGSMGLSAVSPEVWPALQRLNEGGATEAELVAGLPGADGSPTALASLFYGIEALRGAFCLNAHLSEDGAPLLTATPLSPLHPLDAALPSPARAVRVSRFAHLHREDGAWTLESPLSHTRLLVHPGPAWDALALLAAPRRVEELARALPAAPRATLEVVVSWLLACDMAVETAEDGTDPEHTDPVRRQWDAHDLLFHARSRLGRQFGPFGGRYRFLGEIPSLPPVKEPPPGPRLPLPQPDLAAVAARDMTLTGALESRVSVRDYGTRVLSAAELAEFLYRTARVRRRIPTDKGELTTRPYPSGGASYELELYLTVDRCAGLEPGFYHYEPEPHALTRVSGPNAHTEGLLRDAWESAARLCRPQVLITLAARFQRVAWKYDAMAYATVLKNVGVLYQTMYLVATSMCLGPCALGAGNADRFAVVAGTDYLQESSVGEFMLGARPD